jgi:hypothetical protein
LRLVGLVEAFKDVRQIVTVDQDDGVWDDDLGGAAGSHERDNNIVFEGV